LIDLASVVLWAGALNQRVRACWDERMCEIMTCPIKNRINIDPFYERTTALYIGENRIRDVTNGGDQQSSAS